MHYLLGCCRGASSGLGFDVPELAAAHGGGVGHLLCAQSMACADVPERFAGDVHTVEVIEDAHSCHPRATTAWHVPTKAG